MWVSAKIRPVPADDGRKTLVFLKYTPLYGHHYYYSNSDVAAIAWSDDRQCFVELSTDTPVLARDIAEWWED